MLPPQSFCDAVSLCICPYTVPVNQDDIFAAELANRRLAIRNSLTRRLEGMRDEALANLGPQGSNGGGGAKATPPRPTRQHTSNPKTPR